MYSDDSWSDDLEGTKKNKLNHQLLHKIAISGSKWCL